MAGIESGEGFDWYYASETARKARVRSPITDGLAGKHWVFRYKDIEGWWANRHYERVGGVEKANPTAWLARSKPVWFTELGCGAVDKGGNQPNVFADPKSAESAAPYFSNRMRADAMQRRFLEAHHDWWSGSGAPDGMVDPGASVSLVLGCEALSGISAECGNLDRWAELANRALAERAAWGAGRSPM